MSIILVPYNQAMRLGQGYNTYLQKICIDRAVTFCQQAIQTVAYDILKHHSQSTDGASLPQQESTPNDTDTAQIVTYKFAFPDRISDIIEDLNTSAAAGIRAGKLSLNGYSSIDESKFKESHINLFVNVKVTNNKMVLDQELVTFNEMPSVMKKHNTFIQHYGDGFISGFISGGELSGIVNIKLIDPSDLLNVKTSLQGATKGALDNAEGSTSHMNSILNKSAEINITINWTGSGQMKDQWSISNLLDMAAAFPSKVARCPQTTWAIITKYQHLRDYVEKVQYPLPCMELLEYELATSYTGTLLENFIEYKVMMKSIVAMMDNMTGYKKADTKDSYDLNVVSLLKARSDVQGEMAKIVMQVNELNLDPMKALDLAKVPPPDEVTTVTHPHFYTARLPVKCAILEFLPSYVELTTPRIQLPTPRLRLDSIVHTSEYCGPASKSGVSDSMIYKFSSPRMEPPQFATGITHLDISHDGALNLVAEVTDVTQEDYKANIHSLIGTANHHSSFTFFEVAPTDPDFQQGRIITYIPPVYPNDKGIKNYTRFAPAFTEDVAVVVWLTQINAQCFKARYLYIDICLQNVSREGFELSTRMCGGSQYLGCTWIAYPVNNPGIDSGWLDRLVLGLTGEPDNVADTIRTQRVMFRKAFKKPPQVWLAWSGVNLILPDNIRLSTQVVQDSITTTGFEISVRAWGPSVLVSGSLCWLAVEMD